MFTCVLEYSTLSYVQVDESVQQWAAGARSGGESSSRSRVLPGALRQSIPYATTRMFWFGQAGCDRTSYWDAQI